MKKILLSLTSILLVCLSGCAGRYPDQEMNTAQILGTVHDTRGAWNPFLAENNMTWDRENKEFVLPVTLFAKGGRNADGVYALRFSTNHTLEEMYKADPNDPEHRLVTGEHAGRAGNILFAVPSDGTYTVRFSPTRKEYSINPPVRMLTRIENMQINGFVHDAEGEVEAVREGLQRPAERWDEMRDSHQMQLLPDRSWFKTLQLSAKGGHAKNGIYQFLFSAGGNSDWGFCAHNGHPGELLGGCGYNSRVGAIDESTVVVRVVRDGTYTITIDPGKMRFTVFPEVELLNDMPNFQLNGSVLAQPWQLNAPDHQMVRRVDGLWEKIVALDPVGGDTKNGIYVINFSIGAEWALDGIGSGGRWGYTWHSVPQEHNILFRVTKAGDYTVTLDPVAGRFFIFPQVEPIEDIHSLKIAGSFEALADDDGEGWNLDDNRHSMATLNGRLFTRELWLTKGRTYDYKYAANDAGWAWGLADYPYDGERRLALHGNPPPLKFTAQHSGLHRFEADVITGFYDVHFIENE